MVARLRAQPNVAVLDCTEVLAVKGRHHVTGLRLRTAHIAAEYDRWRLLGARHLAQGPGFSRRGVLAALVMVVLPVALWWLRPCKVFSSTAIDETPLGAQTAWLGQFASRIHRTSVTRTSISGRCALAAVAVWVF